MLISRMLLLGLIASSFMAVGQSAATAATAETYSKNHPLKVAIVLNGTLGDRAFLDNAVGGLKRAAADLPMTLKVVEAGYEPGHWQPALADAADGNFDVVICGTVDMSVYLADIALQHPDKKFVLYDETLDFKTHPFPNVLALRFRTAPAGYLAGFVAAKVSKSGTIGTILGMEIPPVMDTKIGFDEGAKAANPNIKILNGVAGVFNDPAKGKEMAYAFINQGADVIFPLASAINLGALQAVRNSHKLAIGAAQDQAKVFAESDPAQANVIVTSYLKDVGQSLYLAMENTIAGTAPYGTDVILGLKENAVGIARNEYYKKLVPPDVQAQVEAVSKNIAAGEINVDTVMH